MYSKRLYEAHFAPLLYAEYLQLRLTFVCSEHSQWA